MRHFRIMTAAEQVAGHLRGRLVDGRLRGEMPGVLKLEEELGVNRNTLEAALRILEQEGWLAPQGAGKPRRIVAAKGRARAGLVRRIGMLVGDAADRRLDYILQVEHELRADGHTLVHAPQAMAQLGMDVKRIARTARKMEVDGWIVLGGSREILEWFVARRMAVFAVFGRWRRLRVAAAAPDKPPVYAEVVRHLAALGHSRIVLLTRRLRRLPVPGAAEQAFLDALGETGMEPGLFHLPDWEETVEGFHARLESLFQVTPPTALLVDEVSFFFATQQFLGRRGLRAPEDVSLVCTDDDPHFEWCLPSVAHIRWDSRPVVRRIVRWVDNLSHGRDDVRQTTTPAEFVAGGTVGEVPRVPKSP